MSIVTIYLIMTREEMDYRPCFPSSSIFLAKQQRDVDDVERRYGTGTVSSKLFGTKKAAGGANKRSLEQLSLISGKGDDTD